MEKDVQEFSNKNGRIHLDNKPLSSESVNTLNKLFTSLERHELLPVNQQELDKWQKSDQATAKVEIGFDCPSYTKK